ncbi:gephyrin-like molybdotransferase Glp [Rivibacter subsaxonicus]|uniref:Molybdopterin molybdenumtransferase n=1 Tax=Rivibacter subsaxonicus TaxID=457575 RepID=A0A4Q7VN91_9BURK|nr:gephyrin-like molybdotransferase Glp [Rivibacter subsaxonicus]RZT97826.1 molybdopterin molybdochelatase [Rivibacter subsaxonicus]
MDQATLPSLDSVASCIGGYDPNALPVTAAQDFVARYVTRVGEVEAVGLREALGRVLAQDLVSPINVPAQDNSAMDGYALASSDLAPDAPTTLRVVGGSAFAGGAPPAAPGRGECVRIMTGAVMPAGCDTVLPQEFCRVDGEYISFAAGILKPGDNRRLAGEDLARGEAALQAGRVLRPADIGIAASLGQATLPLFRKLRVAFFSTGDELRSVGQPLDPGCVYDSNRYTLHAMLTRLGVEVLDLGVVRDDPVALEAAFLDAASRADAIITSGGVSVGEADHTKQVMARLGEVAFWTIAMRPGRPMAFGSIRNGAARAVLFGLPGNPVAVMVTFYAFVRAALLQMAGATPAPLPLLRARAAAPIRKKPGRTEYQRGIVERDADGGDWRVRLTGGQGSGILRSMSQANGLVLLHHAQGAVAAGDWLDVVPFDSLI